MSGTNQMLDGRQPKLGAHAGARDRKKRKKDTEKAAEKEKAAEEEAEKAAAKREAAAAERVARRQQLEAAAPTKHVDKRGIEWHIQKFNISTWTADLVRDSVRGRHSRRQAIPSAYQTSPCWQ